MKTLQDFKDEILATLQNQSTSEGQPYLIVRGWGPYYHWGIWNGTTVDATSLKDAPMDDRKQFTLACKSLESDGIIGQYNRLTTASRGTTCYVFLGLPAKEHEFVAHQVSAA